jgi:hypothetical protein
MLPQNHLLDTDIVMEAIKHRSIPMLENWIDAQQP